MAEQTSQYFDAPDLTVQRDRAKQRRTLAQSLVRQALSDPNAHPIAAFAQGAAGSYMGNRADADEQQAVDEDGKQKLSKAERRELLIKEMKKRIDLYFNINVRQVGDMIPKIVQTFLINEILVT